MEDPVPGDETPYSNTAVTLRALVIGTAQLVPTPVQAPLQFLKLRPVMGVAIRVTVAPAGNKALVAEQAVRNRSRWGHW